MIKKFNQLKRRKGFTLVECIIAIAVFALLTGVILMILVNAQTQAVKSKESEEDLNNLIENVVGDDTYKKYSSDSSNKLVLNFGTDKTFEITYDTVAGYKNYVKCNPDSGADSCGYVGNNTDFMGGKSVADFLSDGDEYTCPQCGEVAKQTLLCEGCLNEGDYNDTAKFGCSSATGSYVCLNCGGGSVKGKDIEEAVTADSDFQVSGLTANSIRYGKVNFSTKPDTLIETGNVDCRIKIDYEHKFDNLTLPGVYTMTFDSFTGTAPASIDIYLPPWYVIGSLTTPASSSFTATAYQEDLSESNIANKDKMSHIRIDATSDSLPGIVKISFTLTNYKNGYSFDYDYRQPYDDGDSATDDSNNYGLIGYWFRIGKHRSSGATTYKTNAAGEKTDIITEDTVTVSYPSGFVL